MKKNLIRTSKAGPMGVAWALGSLNKVKRLLAELYWKKDKLSLRRNLKMEMFPVQITGVAID